MDFELRPILFFVKTLGACWLIFLHSDLMLNNFLKFNIWTAMEAENQDSKWVLHPLHETIFIIFPSGMTGLMFSSQKLLVAGLSPVSSFSSLGDSIQ